MRAPKLARCLAVGLFEGGLEIITVGEACLFGDDFDGEVGLAQETFDFAEADAGDLFLG